MSTACPGVGWHGYKKLTALHLEILEWARGNGCEWNETDYSSVTAMMRWEKVNGYGWSGGVSSNAARGGRLEVRREGREIDR